MQNGEKALDKSGAVVVIYKAHRGVRGAGSGGIAQLGERLNGIQEVSGSIPLISTKTTKSEPISDWRGVRLCFLPTIILFIATKRGGAQLGPPPLVVFWKFFCYIIVNVK